MIATHKPESKSRSRRALLVGALGGLGAVAAAAVGRASSVRGADGETIYVGGAFTGTGTTQIASDPDGGNTVFVAVGITGAGVQGNSTSSVGVEGNSASGGGVHGYSASNIGVYGDNSATDRAAILGVAHASSTGVQAVSGSALPPAAKANTGVYGFANQDSTATGVWGESAKGRGIQGTSSSGYAGYFSGKVFTTKWYELTEISTPNTPGTSRARLFIRDSAGKTQLCVKFGNGQVKVLAVET
jgi:hypothetical protein